MKARRRFWLRDGGRCAGRIRLAALELVHIGRILAGLAEFFDDVHGLVEFGALEIGIGEAVGDARVKGDSLLPLVEDFDRSGVLADVAVDLGEADGDGEGVVALRIDFGGGDGLAGIACADEKGEVVFSRMTSSSRSDLKTSRKVSMAACLSPSRPRPGRSGAGGALIAEVVDVAIDGEDGFLILLVLDVDVGEIFQNDRIGADPSPCGSRGRRARCRLRSEGRGC